MNYRLLLYILLGIQFSIITIFSQEVKVLKIDPLMMVSLKECRNITKSLGDKIFEGWKFNEIPVLFYRPNVQELLINYPHKPAGFSDYKGFDPLGERKIYVRNDSTIFDIDDQNTSRKIDGISVLVVADPYSSIRNQFSDILDRPKDFAEKWLKDWNFIPSPYYKIRIILHEAFHVYQNKMAPDKYGNEMTVLQYPFLDPENNALFVLEGKILFDALTVKKAKLKNEKIKQFVAVSHYRKTLLDSNFAEYENLTEYSEGLAEYVEYKFLNLGESVEPVNEMNYQQGFEGYKGVLSEKFKKALENMMNIVAVNDDRFGNKYGSGPLRFKLYELGACQALLLDDVMPGWKNKIFANNVYLSDLLENAAELSQNELAEYLDKAKNEYNYDDDYQKKLQFQKDGESFIKNKLSAILETNQTLVKIKYGDLVDKIGLGGFTPFGVTQTGKKAAIFDMVPIKVIFKSDATLRMKHVVPVLVDRENKYVAFAVPEQVIELNNKNNNILETDDFILSGVNMELTKQNNVVEINLK